MELKTASKNLNEKNIVADLKDTEQEKENSTIWLERKSFRIALMSTFTALSVVLGYLLVYLPNIELFCLMIFLSGFVLNRRDGTIIGLMSSFIFVFFNPMGSSSLPLLSCQLAFYAFDGFMGGVTSDFLKKRDFYKPAEDLYVPKTMILFGIIGATLTFIYDVFSTIVIALTDFGTIQAFVPYYISGLVFTTIHLIGNTLGFVFILPGLIQLIYKLLD